MRQVIGFALGVLVASAMPAAAQVMVTSADIQRLQDRVFDASTDVARLRGSDEELASELEQELDMLREEVTYLKVKIRRERDVPRSEYTDLRDRIDDLQTRARPQSAAAVPASPKTVPVGSEIDVRLQASLSSKTAQVEDRFDATTLVDLSQGGRVLIPAGSVMRGIVTSVDRATRTDRKGNLSVSFDQIVVGATHFVPRSRRRSRAKAFGVRPRVSGPAQGWVRSSEASSGGSKVRSRAF